MFDLYRKGWLERHIDRIVGGVAGSISGYNAAKESRQAEIKCRRHQKMSQRSTLIPPDTQGTQ